MSKRLFAADVDDDLCEHLRRQDKLIYVDKLIVSVHMAVLGTGELTAECNAVFQMMGISPAADCKRLAFLTGILLINRKKGLNKGGIGRYAVRRV